MAYKLNFFRYSNNSILIDWPQEIDKNILMDVLNFKNRLNNIFVKEKVEVIHTYCSILIIYSHTIDDFNSEYLSLENVYRSLQGDEKPKIRRWHIPVCYDASYASDIIELSEKLNLTISEIIRLHSAPIYTVFFMGFLPGFPYLGGLDSQLYVERKSQPSLTVKKGSVAIAKNQTGIYPQDSPGGWHVIGRTPVELFDPKAIPPTLIEAGDQFRFVQIQPNEFEDIMDACTKGEYQLNYEIVDD